MGKSYKTEGYTLRYYLLYCYPLGLDFQPEDVFTGRMHDARRDKLGNWQNLEGGRPALDPTFVSFLSGIPHSSFAEAIATLKASERGAQLVAALEFYQDWRVNKALGRTPDALAAQLNVKPRQLGRWRDECVDVIRDMVFRVGRNPVPV